jgi:GNAT superfamily N-acetyltransferase
MAGADLAKGVTVRLRDGEPVLLRPVCPEDRERLREGFEAASPRTRRLRFFFDKSHLAEWELRYFTAVDQRDHVAWCALDPVDPGLAGVGIGRFIRDKADPAIAEAALAVTDVFQRQGVGAVLLAALYLRAAAVGVRLLRGFALPGNRHVMDWLGRLGATILEGDTVDQADLPVLDDYTPLGQTDSGRRFQCLLAELGPQLAALCS